MATISPDLTGIVDGAVGDAADWTTPFNTIINAINGGLDTNNFTAAGTNLSTVASSVAWTSFTPTWTGSSVNPAIGNGTLAARYLKVGRWVIAVYFMSAGSTTTFGTGRWDFTLPVTCASATVDYHGSGFASDAGVNSYPIISSTGPSTVSTSVVSPSVASSPTTTVTSSTPFSWGNGDSIQFTIAYESAS